MHTVTILAHPQICVFDCLLNHKTKRKKCIRHKISVLVFSFFKIFTGLQKRVGLEGPYPLLLSDFNLHYNVVTKFSKTSQY
jgi:hypothetical protein